MGIKSKIISAKGLLVKEYSGALNKEDMLVYFTGLYNDPDYLTVSTIFSDFTKANVSLPVKDMSDVAVSILTHAPKVHHINNAILVNKPLVTAYSMIYEAIMKKMPLYECKIFSTFKEAANFIKYDVITLEIHMKTSCTS